MKLRFLIYAIPLTFLAVFFIWPLGAILRLSFTGEAPGATGGLAMLLNDSYYMRVIGFSAWQAFLSTLLTLIAGLPAAYIFARYDFPGKSLLRAIATTPFVMPTVVVAAAFRALLGPNGLLNDLLAGLFGPAAPRIQVMDTLGLVLLAHVFYNYTIVLRIVGGFWSTLDPQLQQAAAVLGASRIRVFREITLPLLLPSIGAAALLTFIFTFSSFGVVLLLGGPRMATVEVEIYRQTATLLRMDVAAALALIQMAATLIMTALYTRLQARAVPLNIHTRTITRPITSWGARLAVGANSIVLLLLLGMPLVALALRSITPLARGAARGFTLEYYRLLNTNPTGSFFFVPPLTALGNSLLFALATLVLALIIGVPAAYLLATRHSGARRTIQRLLDPLFMLPLGTSAVTLGLGYIIALGPGGWLGSPLLVPVAHTLLAFPFVVRSLMPALRALDPRLREAARVLGANPARVLREIDLPLLFPALLVGAVFAFTVSLGEFGATLLLARPTYPTVPLVIARLLGQPGAANYGQALALSTILMLFSMASFVALERARYREASEW